MTRRLFFLWVSVGLYCTDRLRGLWATLTRSARPSRKSILTYHAVTSDQRARFAWQMNKIADLATPFSLDGLEDPEHKGALVAVTFDDGVDCFLDNALPELQAQAISASLFVPAGLLGSFPEWMSESTVEKQGLSSSSRIMTADQVASLPRDLISIGSHSLMHRDLRTLDDADALRELEESRSVLERLLGENVTTIAFPYNSYDLRILALARRAGYERCLAGYRHPSLVDATGSEVRGRIDTSPDDWKLEFILKVKGAYRWRYLACRAKDAVARTAFWKVSYDKSISH